MKLSDIINLLAATSSTNAKKEILDSYKDRADLKAYFKASLDPFINYFIKITELPVAGDSELTLVLINDVVATLAGRSVTGNAARQWISDVLSTLLPKDQILLKNMINHDPNCKVSDGLVNKTWKNLIPSFPCMLSEELNEKTIKYIPEGQDKIIVQKKEDGGRVAVIVTEDHQVVIKSRNGNTLLTHGVFDSVFNRFVGKVFDGELITLDKNGIADRKTSNGIMNKAVRQTIAISEAENLHIVLWDIIDLVEWNQGHSNVSAIDRFARLLSATSVMPKNRVSVSETQIVSTHDEVYKFYDRMIAQGYEGAMVKNAESPWENDRVRTVLKIKEIKDATLYCYATKPHSKNLNMIGSLELRSKCNTLEVSVGSGLTEEDRLQLPEYFIGKFIDIQYNMLITKKSSTVKSMFLPRYKTIREDKTEADSFN